MWFRSYPVKLELYIPTFYKIRYILEELYVAVMWIISRLIIYIDQLNTAQVFFTQTSLPGLLCLAFFAGSSLPGQFEILFDLKGEGRAPKASLIFCSTLFGHCNQNPLLLVELVKSSRGHKKATIMRSCRHPKRHFDSVADNQFQTPQKGCRKPGCRGTITLLAPSLDFWLK